MSSTGDQLPGKSTSSTVPDVFIPITEPVREPDFCGHRRVSGWIWCEHNDAPIGADEEGAWHYSERCPGQHRSLLLGATYAPLADGGTT